MTSRRSDGGGVTLTWPQAHALALMHQADPRYDGEGVVTSGESHLSGGQPWINYRTAEALQRKGLLDLFGEGEERACRRPTDQEEAP